MQAFSDRLEALRKQVADAALKGAVPAENTRRRVLYCEAQLLRMDVGEALLAATDGKVDVEKHCTALADGRNHKTSAFSDAVPAEYAVALRGIDELSASLALVAAPNTGGIVTVVHTLARFACMVVTVVSGSLMILCAVPLRLLHPLLRRWFGVRVDNLPMAWVQSLFGRMCVASAAVHVHGEGLEHLRAEGQQGQGAGAGAGQHGKQGQQGQPQPQGGAAGSKALLPTLLMYSHGSNLDPFIINSRCPVLSKWVAKESIMLIPLLGWALYALGNLPISRSNTSKAIKTLHRLRAKVAQGHSLAIAPEGTRSKSGQLQAFKKGAFHTAKDCGLAITPVMIFGAFELWPPSRAFTLPGQVVVRFLPQWRPPPGEDARLALRRHLLRQACARVPPSAGAPLGARQVAEAALNYAWLAATWRAIWWVVGCYARALGMNGWRCATAAAAFELFIYVREVM